MGGALLSGATYLIGWTLLRTTWSGSFGIMSATSLLLFGIALTILHGKRGRILKLWTGILMSIVVQVPATYSSYLLGGATVAAEKIHIAAYVFPGGALLYKLAAPLVLSAWWDNISGRGVALVVYTSCVALIFLTADAIGIGGLVIRMYQQGDRSIGLADGLPSVLTSVVFKVMGRVFLCAWSLVKSVWRWQNAGTYGRDKDLTLRLAFGRCYMPSLTFAFATQLAIWAIVGAPEGMARTCQLWCLLFANFFG